MKIIESKYHTCIVTFPISRAFRMPLLNLVDVVSHISKKTSVIIGSYDDMELDYPYDSNVSVKQFDIGKSSDLLRRIVRFVKFQIWALISFLRIINETDVIIFFMEWDPLLFIIISKFFGKKTIWMLPSSAPLMRKYNADPLLAFSKYTEWLSYRLSKVIILLSENLIKDWDLVEWEKKIVIAHNHFIDFHQFKITKSYCDREQMVGYIGRFSKEKGTGNFLKAAELILKDYPEVLIPLGGSGDLKKCKFDLNIFQEQDQIRIRGWIPHDNLSNALNDLKLLVIPSNTEGLPNMMLEALACGTPVLATPVGGIPDVIRDNETGFIMESNTPECIVDNVFRALRSPYLERVSENGKYFVEEKFTFEKTVEKWRKILDENT